MGIVSGPEHHTHEPSFEYAPKPPASLEGSGVIDSARVSPLWHHIHGVGPVKPLRKPLRARGAPNYDIVALAEREEETSPELERRRVNWHGLAHDVPKAFRASARIYHDIKGKRDAAELVARRVNWHGLAHDTSKAFHAGEGIYHDIKSKRGDELVARRANWHGLTHDIPKAFHAGARVYHDTKGRRDYYFE